MLGEKVAKYIGIFISSMSSCMTSGSSIELTTTRMPSRSYKKGARATACSAASPSKASMRGRQAVRLSRTSICVSTCSEVGGESQKGAHAHPVSIDASADCG